MFADHILEMVRVKPTNESELMLSEMLKHPKTVHIVADNVVAYLRAKYDSSLDSCKFFEAASDMFCLMAPANYTWFEYKIRPARKSERHHDLLDQFTHLGTLAMFGPNNDSLWEHVELPPEAAHMRQQSAYAIGLYHYLGGRRDFATTNYSSWIFLDKEGAALTYDEEGSCLLCSMHVQPETLIGKMGHASTRQEVMQLVSQSAYELALVPLYTMALLNIKNIVMEHQRRDAKLVKHRKKSGKPDYLRAYTLAIDVSPTGKPLRGAVQSTGTPLPPAGAAPQALHLVRGHVADYRHGNGLFGKHKGIFWIPSHHRGREWQGKIDKVYQPEVVEVES